MKLDLVDLFPQTIAVARLETLTPDVIARAIEFIDFGSSVSDFDYDGSYTREQDILDKSFFREVKQEIIQLCLEFAQAYSHDVKAIGICNSWGNVVGNRQSIRYHKHNNSYISGSFYLTEGSDFNMLNNHFNEMFGLMPALLPDSRENFRAWESFSLSPKPGRVVLFPSGMRHCVLASNSEEKRYSIAFNAVPLGRIGVPTGQIDIQIP